MMKKKYLKLKQKDFNNMDMKFSVSFLGSLPPSTLSIESLQEAIEALQKQMKRKPIKIKCVSCKKILGISVNDEFPYRKETQKIYCPYCYKLMKLKE